MKFKLISRQRALSLWLLIAVSLHPMLPCPADTAADGGATQIVAANSLPPGTVCVQWIWTDVDGSDCAGSNCFAPGVDDREGDRADNQLNGLFPARAAFILLGPPLAAGGGDGERSSGPSITTSHVPASSVDGLRRRASQLKVEMFRFRKSVVGRCEGSARSWTGRLRSSYCECGANWGGGATRLPIQGLGICTVDRNSPCITISYQAHVDYPPKQCTHMFPFRRLLGHVLAENGSLA